jgi:kumamolisin
VVTIEVEKLSPQDRNDPGGIGECMLDVEVVAGVCPRSTLAVYFSNFTEKGWVDVLE